MRNVRKFIFMELLVFIALGIVFFSNSRETQMDAEKLSIDENPKYSEWTGTYLPGEINTRAQIYDIGRRLGKGIFYQERVLDDAEPFVKGNPAYKYSAARVYGTDKCGADIIFLGETATVDTVKCLRMIVSGYLQEAFKMNASDSDSVALTVIQWNTVVYNNIDFFKKNFDDGIIEKFSDRTKKIGLSANYKEWAGQSKIVIPHKFEKVEPVVEEVKPVETQPEPVPVAQTVVEEVKPVETAKPVVVEQKSESVRNSPSVQKPKQGFLSKKMLYLIVGGIAVAVTAFGIIYFVLLRKKDEEEDVPSDNSSEKKDESDMIF